MNGDAAPLAILSPSWFPVPPTGYGGIEWVVSLLADGLVRAGHDVTLFASGDSRTKAKLAWVYEHRAERADRAGRCPSCATRSPAYERAGEFDVINDHSGPPGAALGGAVETPVVHTVHGPLDGEPGEVYEQIARVAPTVGLISLSLNQRKPKPDLPLGREHSRTRSTSRLYPVQAAPRRLPALPRPDEPRQGRAPGDRGRDGGGRCR